jgi:hypothetical protein
VTPHRSAQFVPPTQPSPMWPRSICPISLQLTRVFARMARDSPLTAPDRFYEWMSKRESWTCAPRSGSDHRSSGRSAWAMASIRVRQGLHISARALIVCVRYRPEADLRGFISCNSVRQFHASFSAPEEFQNAGAAAEP